MKIATWNVNGIRARRDQFPEWAAREQPDVICLQELKAQPDQIPDGCRLAQYDEYWHGRRAYSGVSLQVRKGAFDGAPVFGHPEFDFESRIVHAELGRLVVASVYVPNGGKDFGAKLTFVRGLVGWARRLHAEGRELLLCGDLNITRAEIDVHPKERKAGVVGQRPDERQLFEDLLGGELVDVGRALDPDNAGLFTWWAPWRDMRARNIGWRIDYILASTTLATRASRCAVRADVGTSDHAPVVLELD